MWCAPEHYCVACDDSASPQHANVMMQDAEDKHPPKANHGCITDVKGLPAWQLGQLCWWEGAT